MKGSTKESPIDRGEVEMPGRCQVCGEVGKTIAVPGAPPPNEFCPRCAIEYGEAAGEEDEEGAPI
ncbi:MAG TPA: hypothetical protein VD838_03620 [Anaeromyxobacteraceae bacterium]|nr:hypothetical protein [Anaeromyxobacteraceae bacterium]